MIQKTEFLLQSESTPVVMLHSSVSSKKAPWLKLCESLRGDYRVLAVDLYGYGDAGYPSAPDQFTLLDEAGAWSGLSTNSSVGITVAM